MQTATLLNQGAWIFVALLYAVVAMVSKRNVQTESMGSRVGHIATFAVALALLFSTRAQVGPLGWQVIPQNLISAYVGLAITIAGIFFAIWARLQLGGNWSSVVAIKKDHTHSHRSLCDSPAPNLLRPPDCHAGHCH
jgi:protein-S-isoprenylcysteine O-methyltransferase Ste14